MINTQIPSLSTEEIMTYNQNRHQGSCAPPTLRTEIILVFGFLLSIFILTSAGYDTSEGYYDYAVAHQIWTQGTISFAEYTEGISTKAPNGRVYASHEIGNALFLLPVAGLNVVLEKALAGRYDKRRIGFVTSFLTNLMPAIYCSVTIALFYAMLRIDFGKSRSAAFASSMAFTFCTFVWSYSRILSDVVLCMCLLTAALFSMIRFRRTMKVRYFLIAITLCGLGVIARLTMVLLLVAFAAYLTMVFWRDWKRLVPAVAAGAAIVWLAAWVYLSAFTASASGYDTAVRLVPWNEHTPPLLFLLFLLPTIAFIVLGYVSGSPVGRRLSMLWLTLLLFTEFFYVDDEYSGLYDRFNTTLKWWPWVMAGTLMTLAPVVLEQAKRKWVRVAGFVFCLYPCFYAYDLWKPLRDWGKGSMGKIEGHYFLTKEEFPRLMLGRLKVEKPGVVIERPEEKGGFTNSAVIPLFAGQRMWLGWWGHELLWRANSEDIRRRHDKLTLFYNGDFPDAGKWWVAQGVDYVLWYRPGDTPAVWAKINKELSPEYVWCDILTYQDEDGRRVGLWKRAPQPPP